MESRGIEPRFSVCKTEVFPLNYNPKIKMTFITKICPVCKTSFNARPSEINRGGGIYCSRPCFGKVTQNRMTKPKNPNVNCATCGEQLFRTKHQQKASKSGLFFCNSICRNEAQKIHSHVNFKLSHYKSGKYIHYRTILPDVTEMQCPQCNRLLPITCIDVHHIDSDRSNNNPNNLFICCPTCHRLKHNNCLEQYV